jgi:hypothetical protein
VAKQDYLRIARSFQPANIEPEPVPPLVEVQNQAGQPQVHRGCETTQTVLKPYEINEIDELSAPGGLFEGVDEAAVAKAYETKATLPSGKPPLQQIEELQAWLATIDWRQGLKCSSTGMQCKVCKGVPCRGSTEWPREPEQR